MDPKASKSSRKPRETCENFEKLREKFYKNFFHGVVITPNGIVGLLQKYKVSQTALGLLSVDVDSYDFWVLKKILEAGFRQQKKVP